MGIGPEFAAFLAAPIPAVDPEDMRRIWPLFERLWLEEQRLVLQVSIPDCWRNTAPLVPT
jgi:hypothetical protein